MVIVGTFRLDTSIDLTSDTLVNSCKIKLQ